MSQSKNINNYFKKYNKFEVKQLTLNKKYKVKNKQSKTKKKLKKNLFN